VITHGLAVIGMVGSGIVAGVLFAVAISHVPALQAMPPDRYVEASRLLGSHWDPVMPVIVLVSTLAEAGLAFQAPAPPARVAFAVSAVFLLAVSGVSHLANVPINRQVKGLDTGAIPADWRDPRPVWKRWHLLRTGLAFAALVVSSVAITTL
jgi:uncharacterized membrane protein